MLSDSHLENPENPFCWKSFFNPSLPASLSLFPFLCSALQIFFSSKNPPNCYPFSSLSPSSSCSWFFSLPAAAPNSPPPLCPQSPIFSFSQLLSVFPSLLCQPLFNISPSQARRKEKKETSSQLAPLIPDHFFSSLPFLSSRFLPSRASHHLLPCFSSQQHAFLHQQHGVSCSWSHAWRGVPPTLLGCCQLL